MIEGTTVGVVAVRPLGSTLEFPGSIIDTYRRGEGFQPGPNCTSWKQLGRRFLSRRTPALGWQAAPAFPVAVSFEHWRTAREQENAWPVTPRTFLISSIR